MALLVNFLLLERILVSDPCYYHIHEAGPVFRLFYEFTTDGGHPFPTILNVAITIMAGGGIGYATARHLLKVALIKQSQAMQF
jgi:hypothetical protein